MTGRNQLVFGPDDLARGMSTNTFLKDAGFSNEEGAINIAVTPGLAYGPADTVDSDTDVRLTDEIIASSTDNDISASSYQRKMVTEDKKYYRYNGTKIPEAALRTDATSNTYIKGTTDMISFAGSNFVTTREAIIRWDETGAVFNTSFATFTNGSFPHPAIVFENNAFYGDKNLLLRQTVVGTAPSTILTLSSEQAIFALGIDRGTGKLLIATTDALDVGNIKSHIHKIHWYDGFSNKTSKTVEVEDMVTAFYSIGNTVYVGYGDKLGILNGSGIQFLRILKNVTLTLEDLPYKHNFTSIGSTLYVVDGDQILAYGPIKQGGPNVFYYLYLNDITADAKFKTIFYVGNNKLGISSTTSKFHTLSVTSVADTSNGLDVWTNWYDFPRPVILKGAQIEFIAATTLSNLTLQYRYNTDTTTRALAVEGGNYSSAFVVANLVGFLPTKITGCRFRIALASQNTGFRKMIIHYDYAE